MKIYVQNTPAGQYWVLENGVNNMTGTILADTNISLDGDTRYQLTVVDHYIDLYHQNLKLCLLQDYMISRVTLPAADIPPGVVHPEQHVIQITSPTRGVIFTFEYTPLSGHFVLRKGSTVMDDEFYVILRFQQVVAK